MQGSGHLDLSVSARTKGLEENASYTFVDNTANISSRTPMTPVMGQEEVTEKVEKGAQPDSELISNSFRNSNKYNYGTGTISSMKSTKIVDP